MFQALKTQYRKIGLDLDTANSDLTVEKNSVLRLEGLRTALERQNKELKSKLSEMDSELRTKYVLV